MKISHVIAGLLFAFTSFSGQSLFAADDSEAKAFCQQQADLGNFANAEEKAAYIAECMDAMNPKEGGKE